MRAGEDLRPIRVFVHLAFGFGAKQWQERWHNDQLVGVTDRLPYGYFHAAEQGCRIEYSKDKEEGWLERFTRLAVRVALGFDFVHAWRNRRGIMNADVIWTHTESQHLAVLLLLRGRRGHPRPRVIAQSIWLFDRWPQLSPAKRWLYARLLSHADLLTVHSPKNFDAARALFPATRCELVRFGISTDRMAALRGRPAQHPVHVISLGHDEHRDWPTLIEAVRGWPGATLRIVAPRVSRRLFRGADNVTLFTPRSTGELAELYDWADLVALALKPNLHASGVTVIEEATVFGVPVICSDTGGLRAYFSEREVRYVPTGDYWAIRHAIAELAGNDEARHSMVERARARVQTEALNSRGYALRHAALSREMLAAERQEHRT